MAFNDFKNQDSKCNQDSVDNTSKSDLIRNDRIDIQLKFSNKDLNNENYLQISHEDYLSKLLESLKDVTYKYQYLDHPADVILLGDGNSIKKALESISVSLYNYISDLSYIKPTYFKKIEISGRGLLNLLYHFLDECLYLYSSEYFIGKHVIIQDDIIIPITHSSNEFNNYTFNITVFLLGDFYNKNFHKSGTEIKAITMHYLCYNIWVCDKCYEYKNDMESLDQTEKLLIALKNFNNKITRCKVFALVDI